MLPVRFGKRWQLFIITPLNDFTSPFKHNDRRLLFGGLIAIAVQILIINVGRFACAGWAPRL